MDQLSKLLDKHGSDKGPNHHGYSVHYYEILKGLQHSPLVFLEIGVGGYQYPDRGGGSLRAFEEFFTKGQIHGIDIYDKSPMNKGRVHTHLMSQTNREGLRALLTNIGTPDIILDDGSHVNAESIITFETLFPKLKKGGIYIVEDTECSYWELNYFGSENIDDLRVKTVMNYFKRLTDGLNAHIFPYDGPKFDIKSISFYKGFIVIYKN